MELEISTVTVLSRLSDTTTPVRTLRRARSLIGLVLHLIERLDLLLAHGRGDPGDIPSHLLDPSRVVELVGRQLEPKVEKRFLESMDIPDVDEVFPLVPEVDEEGNETGAMTLKFPPQPDPQLEIEKADMQRRTLEGQSRAEKDMLTI